MHEEIRKFGFGREWSVHVDSMHARHSGGTQIFKAPGMVRGWRVMWPSGGGGDFLTLGEAFKHASNGIRAGIAV